jgi:hypothetical protein
LKRLVDVNNLFYLYSIVIPNQSVRRKIARWLVYQALHIYNIKYMYHLRLDTCLMSISRFFLRDKVTLPLLELYFYIEDVAEGSRVLNKRLSDWCCSASMVWVQIPSREEQKTVSSWVKIFRRTYKYICRFANLN